ncbi:MAG: hypothetical protein M1453_11930 [Acidobacteria bacterium]|nr:hypothetical protein [Acidobacteriota bacterium]MCL5288687.1 hypothetical protein [Acidobacteriota bacterium]
MKRMIQALVTVSALLLMTCAAGAQQAPPPKQEPAKPKVKKVWSNDDLDTLRRPADSYEEAKRKKAEEEAAQAKEKAAADKAAAAGEKKEEKPDFLPKTVEEAEKQLGAKRYEIGQQYEAIDLVKLEMANAKTDESRAAFQKRIDQLTATLDEAIAEMKDIDKRLTELKSKPPAPAKAPPAKP